MLTFPPHAPVVPSGYLSDYAWGVTVVALFYLVPLGAAWRMVRWLLGDSVPPWLALSISLVLSPMLLALALFAAGLAHVLIMPVVLGILVGLLVLWLRQRHGIAAACSATVRSVRRPGIIVRVLLAFCFALVIVQLLSCFAAPVDYDCVWRKGHLQLAVTYAENGALPIAEGNQNFGAPHLYHMLLVALYLLRAPAGPAFLAASQTILLAVVAAGFATLWWGLEAGSVAAALLLGGGLALKLGHAPRSDVPAALLGVTSILLWACWLSRPDRKLLLAISLFAGLAAATKITWWLFLPAQTLLVLAGPPGAALRIRIREAIVFVALPVLLISPWIVRSQVLTGTPVYPLTWRYTGGKYWSESQDQVIRTWFDDYTRYEWPILLRAPARVPKKIAGILRSDWALLATVGLCLAGALCYKAVGGPIVPLLIGAALYSLAITGFLDSAPRHLMPGFVVGAVVAGGVFAADCAERLGKAGRLGVVVFVALAAMSGRSPERYFAPAFLFSADRGPPAVARQVGLSHPYGECELWVNSNSPRGAVVLLLPLHDIDFYLRRDQVSLNSLLENGVLRASLPSLLDDLAVDYIIFHPVAETESKPWWVGDWREKHWGNWEFDVILPLRAALTAEVDRADRWRLAFESRQGWCVYERTDGVS